MRVCTHRDFLQTVISLGHTQLYAINNLVVYVTEHSTAEKWIIRPERTFSSFLKATKSNLFQFLMSCDKDDVSQVVRALYYK